MPEQRSIRTDVFALALFALCAFLLVSLTSYRPADANGSLIYPPGENVLNACGRSGAFVSELMFRIAGVGAWFILLSLAVVDFFLLGRRTITEPILRTIGWIMSLVGICTFASLALPNAGPGPVIGPGGYIGAAGRTILEMNFAHAGALILTISVILSGLLLSTDYFLIRLTVALVRKPTLLVALVGRKAISKSPSAEKTAPSVKIRGRRTDTDEAVPDIDLVTEKSAKEPAVRVRGKRGDTDTVATVADEVSDTEVEDDGANEEADAEDGDATAPVKTGLGSRLASALRIKNNGKSDARDQVIEDLEAASRNDEAIDYELPPIDLLLPNETIFQEEHEKEVREKAKKLEATFLSFGFKVKVVEIETGPVIAQYEVELEAGLRLSKITSLADDIAIALRVPSVRIVAPIPGKNTLGIEVPNATRQLVRLREVIEETNGKAKKMKIPIFLGKDVAGNPMTVDLATLPHLLIAGRTGTGKSVCLNSIIVSMLMSRGPDEVKMLMIDPKMVELSPYKRLPHLMHPVVTDMRKAEAILAWGVEKMEERYALLARAGVRHISSYNQLGEEELMDRLQPETDEERKSIPLSLPYIVIVADEIADLMMTSGKEVEQHIIRLAQKSRAVGIHLILATQKPTVDVITGLIKSNLPARIAFQVASRTDSRVVLDEMGADKLLGNGDMLFLWPGTSTLLRGQGTYLSDDEINRVVDFVSTTEPQFAKELVTLKPKDDGTGKTGADLKSRDELYESAIDVVIREGRGSVSLLQRALGIGYGRAARLVDYMAEDGIVGEYNGSQAREVLITLEQWAAMSGEQVEAPAAPPKAKKNRIKPLPVSADELVDDDSYDRSEMDSDSEDDDEPDHDPDDDPGPVDRSGSSSRARGSGASSLKGPSTRSTTVRGTPAAQQDIDEYDSEEDEDYEESDDEYDDEADEIEDDSEVSDAFDEAEADDDVEDESCEDEDEPVPVTRRGTKSKRSQTIQISDSKPAAGQSESGGGSGSGINPALLERLQQKKLQQAAANRRKSA
ncbi:MAG: DNA translocase FtsK [Planctomycetota bacterium]|nr:DNA translocase FtsK [Planctomycetota bacterium]